MEGARRGGARARARERGGSPPPCRGSRAASHRADSGFRSRRAGENRRTDGDRAGAHRAPHDLRSFWRARAKEGGEALSVIDTAHFRELLLDERARVESAIV